MFNSSSPTILFSLLFLFSILSIRSDDTIASCGDCWCIPGGPGEPDVCPTSSPPAHYPQTTIDALSQQIPSNPYQLNCEPFDELNCTTTPPQDSLIYHGTDAVCGIKYLDSNCSSYEMNSYKSLEKAEKDGAFVTHTGACGVCSTTQDLAAYMANPDMEKAGTKCTILALQSTEKGIECYESLGFSEDCSKIWVYDGYNTNNYCSSICRDAQLLNWPDNGPPPSCPLNYCLQCDEDFSGPMFKRVAGRTRRRSGIRSAIARSCYEIANISQVPCPQP